jgi:citrate synthase
MKMFENMKEPVKDWTNKGEIEEYLSKILNKEAFEVATPFVTWS